MSGSVLAFAVTAVLLPLVLAEFGDWSSWLAARLVRWAARRLPDAASRSRYEEEWAANLDMVPGRLGRLLAAVGYVACLPAMRRSVSRRPPQPALPAPKLLRAPQAQAVFHLARDAGIRQFLDVRAGMPGAVRTHELAWMLSPECRIFYAADSPSVIPPGLPLPYLEVDHATADPRDPEAILWASAGTLDFSQPVAVLLRGLLGYVGDHDEARAIAGRLMQAVPSGSYLVLTDRAGLFEPGWEARQAGDGTSALPPPIAGIIDGLEMIDPGHISKWSELPASLLPHIAEAATSCVVARKP